MMRLITSMFDQTTMTSNSNLLVVSSYLVGLALRTLPCTDDGNDILDAFSFKINRDLFGESTNTLQQASPASKGNKCDDENA